MLRGAHREHSSRRCLPLAVQPQWPHEHARTALAVTGGGWTRWLPKPHDSGRTDKGDTHRMIGNTNVLPAQYAVRTTVDLKTDRKIAAAIQVVVISIAVVLVGLALILDFPFSSDFSTWVTIVMTVVACLFYMVVHELTHAGFLWLFSRTRPAVMLRIPYLAVGGRGYLNTRSFLVVALAPVVVWGFVLVTLLLTLPSQFFFSVYVVTILNFAGSSGDYFQAYAVAKIPSSALIQDDGRVTTVYLPAE
nr:DUF3267 domain-containing protein [Rhodococcus qingshengii]